MFWRSHLVQEQEKYECSWLVFRYDWNQRAITLYNVLTHPTIVKICQQSGKHVRLRTFEKRLIAAVHREFSFRCEWEIGVTDSNPSISADELNRLIDEAKNSPDRDSYDVNLRVGGALDVAYQLWMNWKQFLHYVYRHRDDIVQQSHQLYR